MNKKNKKGKIGEYRRNMWKNEREEWKQVEHDWTIEISKTAFCV